MGNDSEEAGDKSNWISIHVHKIVAAVRTPLSFYALAVVALLIVAIVASGIVQGIAVLGILGTIVYVMVAMPRWRAQLLERSPPAPVQAVPPAPSALPLPASTTAPDATTLPSDATAAPIGELTAPQSESVSTELEADPRASIRAREVDRKLTELAAAGAPNWAKHAAALASDLLRSGATDYETMHVIRGWAMAWGWQIERKVSFSEIYDALSREDSSRFLLALVRQRAPRITFARGRSFDAAAELREHYWADLHADQRAEVHLAIGRQLWTSGDEPNARVELSKAAALTSSHETKEQVHVQRRDWAFTTMSATAVRAAMDTEVVDSDTVARQLSRRGADALLLGEADIARTFYEKALACAKTGDERSVALLGLLIALDPLTNFEEHERLRLLLVAIPESERAEEAAVEKLLHRAGTHALRGEESLAADRLSAFLVQARGLGWPHSGRVNNIGPLENAARDLCRIWMSKSSGSSAFELRRAFETVLTYGLVKDVRKLTDTDLVQRILEAPEVRTYLRSVQASAASDLLPRSELAGRALRAHLLPVLEDDTIVEVVRQLRDRMGRASDPDATVDDEWRGVVSNAPCLPERARVVAASIEHHILSESARAHPIHGRLDSLFWEFWRKLGGPPGQVCHDLSTAVAARIAVAKQEGDDRLERDMLGRLVVFAEEGILVPEARSQLARELAGTGVSDDSHVELYRILAAVALDAADAETLLERTVRIFACVRRSTEANAWCWVAESLVRKTSRAATELINAAIKHGRDALDLDRREFRLFSALRAARLLRALSDVASNPPEVVSVLKELALRDLRSAGSLGGSTAASGDISLGELGIHAALFDYQNPDRRRAAVFAVADWLELGGRVPRELRCDLRQLAHADVASVRIAAHQVFRSLIELAPETDELAWLAAQSSTAAKTDPHWVARANAGHTYIELATVAPHLADNFDTVLRALENDESALSRRVAELGSRRLRSIRGRP